jgi:hypothetical protein
MGSVMRLLFLLLVAGTVSFCTAPMKPFTLYGNMPLAEPETKLYFPSYICDLEKAEMTVFPREGLGISFSYADRYMTSATFYIYDMTLDTISNGISEIVSASFERTLKELEIMEQLGYYQNVEVHERATTTLTINGTPINALFAECSYISDRLQSRSYVLMAGYRNKILKIRYTFPEEVQWQSIGKWECLTNSLGDSLFLATTASR